MLPLCQFGALAVGAWRKLGVAEVPLGEVLRGSLRPLPAGPNTPPGQQAAAILESRPSACSARGSCRLSTSPSSMPATRACAMPRVNLEE